MKKIDSGKAATMIRKARKTNRISLEALSDKMGISISYLHELEHGRRNWTEAKFQLAALGISQLRTKQ